MSKITAQVAAEAICNMPEAYDVETMQVVLRDAHAAGVSDFYLDPIRALIREV